MATTSAQRQLLEINPPTAWWRAPFEVVGNAFRFRFLISSFVARDLRVRYRNSILGYFWSLLEPLLMTLIYFVLFAVVFSKPEPEYFLWVVVGALTWQYFTKSMTNSVTALTGNASMIKQVYFPRELFTVATVASETVIALLSLLITIPMMIYFGVRPNIYLLYIPTGLLLAALLAAGVGMGFSVLNAVHRDVQHFFRFVTRAGFYLSPVMWTLHHIPKSKAAYLDLMLYNPMVVVISMVRAGIECRPLDHRLHAGDIAYSVGCCVIAFVVGSMFFKKFEPEVVKNI